MNKHSVKLFNFIKNNNLFQSPIIFFRPVKSKIPILPEYVMNCRRMIFLSKKLERLYQLLDLKQHQFTCMTMRVENDFISSYRYFHHNDKSLRKFFLNEVKKLANDDFYINHGESYEKIL